MMNVASIELCKELYELSGWKWPEFTWFKPDRMDSEWDVSNGPHEKGANVWPAYDLGYLLRKLPKYASIGQMISSDELWVATCSAFHPNRHPYCAANTPEDALAKLAIELFKEGVLK